MLRQRPPIGNGSSNGPDSNGVPGLGTPITDGGGLKHKIHCLNSRSAMLRIWALVLFGVAAFVAGGTAAFLYHASPTDGHRSSAADLDLHAAATAAAGPPAPAIALPIDSRVSAQLRSDALGRRASHQASAAELVAASMQHSRPLPLDAGALVSSTRDRDPISALDLESHVTALQLHWAAHAARINAYLSVGNEPSTRTALAARSVPAKLKPVDQQNEWGRRYINAHLNGQQRERLVRDSDAEAGRRAKRVLGLNDNGLHVRGAGAAARSAAEGRRHPDVGSSCGGSTVPADSGLQCTYYPAPGASVQCCCVDTRSEVRATASSVYFNMTIDEADERFFTGRRLIRPASVAQRFFTCLPSLVIAGVQKAGTTALFGYLLHHPSFLNAARKEVHYFDKVFGQGTAGYLKSMPHMLPPPPRVRDAIDSDVADGSGTARRKDLYQRWLAYVGSHITGEASPAYVLGMDTAARIQTTLPHGKVVVILRDPVDRAYSEYQMKVRRIEGQIHVENATEMQSVMEASHACFARSYQPLMALLKRASDIISSKVFEKRISQLAAQLSSAGGRARHPLELLKLDPSLTPASDVNLLQAGRTAAIHQKPLPASFAPTSLDYDVFDQPLWNSLHVPVDIGSGAFSNDLDALLSLYTSESESSSSSSASSDITRYRERVVAARHAIAGVWNAFVDAMIDNAPLASSGSDGAEDGEGNGFQGFKRASMTAVEEFVAGYWQQYGHNISNACLQQDVLSHPGLSPISRLGKPVMDSIKACMLDAAGPKQGLHQSGQSGSLSSASLSGVDFGWLGSYLPGTVDLAFKVASVTALSSSSSNSIGASQLSGFNTASTSSSSPYPAAMDSGWLTCFNDDRVVGTTAPRYENVGAMTMMFVKEAGAINSCSSKGLLPGGVRAALGIASELQDKLMALPDAAVLSSVPDGPRSVIVDGQKGCWPTGATSNIAYDFLYRGLYVKQIARLHAALGRDRVLVVSDSELRSDPQGTLDTLCDFIGLPRLDVSDVTSDDVSAALDAAYPAFGRTGWRLDGGYAKMDDKTRAHLTAFYAPHNRALYEYLGRDFGWQRPPPSSGADEDAPEDGRRKIRRVVAGTA